MSIESPFSELMRDLRSAIANVPTSIRAKLFDRNHVNWQAIKLDQIYTIDIHMYTIYK